MGVLDLLWLLLGTANVQFKIGLARRWSGSNVLDVWTRKPWRHEDVQENNGLAYP